MRLIYITGAPRCGKTTLANQMAKEQNVSVFSLDAFSKAVRSAFDDFKLYTDEISIRPTVNGDTFLDLTANYIHHFFADYHNQTLIVEGCHFTPTAFHARFPDAEIIALGRTGEIKEIIEAIKEKDRMQTLPEKTINRYAELIRNDSMELKHNAGFYRYIEI